LVFLLFALVYSILIKIPILRVFKSEAIALGAYK